MAQHSATLALDESHFVSAAESLRLAACNNAHPSEQTVATFNSAETSRSAAAAAAASVPVEVERGQVLAQMNEIDLEHFWGDETTRMAWYQRLCALCVKRKEPLPPHISARFSSVYDIYQEVQRLEGATGFFCLVEIGAFSMYADMQQQSRMHLLCDLRSLTKEKEEKANSILNHQPSFVVCQWPLICASRCSNTLEQQQQQHSLTTHLQMNRW